jgi:hypothetical protein
VATNIAFGLYAKDHASGTFAKVGHSADLTGGKMRKMGAAAKVGFTALAAGAAIAGIAAFKFAKGAMEDQQAAAKLALQLKNSAGATKGQVAATEQWITAQGKALGVADDDLRPALSNLVTATHDVGKAQRLTSLAMDISAAKGKSLKSVSEALMKAQNGNVGGLGRLGVATKDAAGKTLSFEAIQKNLAKTFHGSAKTAAETTAGRFQRLKLIMSETGESIGYKLLPPLTKLAGWVLSTGLPAMSRFGNWMSTTFGPVLARLGGYISGTIVPAFRQFGAVASEKLAAVMPRIQAGATKVRAVLEQVGGVIQTRVLPIIKSLVIFYATQWLPMQAKIYAQVATKLKPILDQLAVSFQGKILPAVDRALKKFHEWQPTIQKVALKVGTLLGKLTIFTAAVAGKVIPILIRFQMVTNGVVIKTLIALGTYIVHAYQKVYAFGAAFVGVIQKVARFASAVTNKVAAVVNIVRGIPGRVTGAIGNLGSLLYNAGKDVVQGLINGITAKAGELLSKVKGLAHSVSSAFAGALKIHSPSRVFLGHGANIMKGLINGIEKGRKPLEVVLDKVTANVKAKGDKLKDLLGKRSDFAAGFQMADSIFATPDTETTTTDADGNDVTTTSGPTLASMKAFALQQQTQAAQVNADVKRLMALGLSKSLITQMQSQGASGVAQMHALAGGSAADIAGFNAIDKDTRNLYGGAGMAAGNAIYGDSISDAKKADMLAKAVAKAVREEMDGYTHKQMERLEFRLEGNTLVASLKAEKKKNGNKKLGLD